MCGVQNINQKFSLIFLSTFHSFLVKSMDISMYINFVDTMGQHMCLYPNKCILIFVTLSPKNLHKKHSNIINLQCYLIAICSNQKVTISPKLYCTSTIIFDSNQYESNLIESYARCHVGQPHLLHFNHSPLIDGHLLSLSYY